jgi:hypothetical protein
LQLLLCQLYKPPRLAYAKRFAGAAAGLLRDLMMTNTPLHTAAEAVALLSEVQVMQLPPRTLPVADCRSPVLHQQPGWGLSEGGLCCATHQNRATTLANSTLNCTGTYL